MFKVIILAAIVSVSAQFGHNRGLQEHQDTQGGSEERASQDYEGHLSPRNRHRGYDRRNVGGFQNSNFAPHDGILKTNLNSDRGAGEHRQKSFLPEGSYVVEGAAFRRQDNLFVDSSGGSPQRGEDQNVETQDRGRLEQSINNNESTQNLNDQRHRNQNVRYNDQSALRSTNNNRSKFANQETQNENNKANVEVTLDQNKLRDQITNQNSQESNAQADRNRNEDEKYKQTTRHQGDVNTDGRRSSNTHVNRPYNQNKPNQADQNINSNKTNPNNGQNVERHKDSASTINNRSRAIAGHRQLSTNLNLGNEAKERELNNQITKLIFEESTQPTHKGKTTEDNELHPHTELPNRNVSGKEDDRWIWSEGSEGKVSTEDSSTPGVDDRAAFVGSQCATGQTKINGMCVDED